MKLTIRFVTIICCFLPFTFFFTTCNNTLELRFSYNEVEANQNILLKEKSSEAGTDTVQYNQQVLIDTAMTDTVKTSADTLQKLSNYKDKIFRKIIMPTEL